MAYNTQSGIVSQDPAHFGSSVIGAICHNYHSCVYAISHSNATTMMQTYPTGPRGCIYQCIQDRPVSNGITSIQHRLSFPVGAGYGACVQVITANNNWRFYLSIFYQFIKRKSCLFPFPLPYPANTSR